MQNQNNPIFGNAPTSGNFPPQQPTSFPTSGSVVAPPTQPTPSVTSGSVVAPPIPSSTGGSVVSPPTPPVSYPAQKQDLSKPILIVALIVVSLIAGTFIGLFIWKFIEWDEANTNVQGQVDNAVATAVSIKSDEMNLEFAEREKDPREGFVGPDIYGSVSFVYPKTWSVYEAKDAANGGDFEAYFNPDIVYSTSDAAVNSLRVNITNESFDNVISEYNGRVKDGEMTAYVRQINGENATVFTGTLPSELVGKVAIFKIRDKTVIFQTDSELFYDEFENILNSITYNK